MMVGRKCFVPLRYQLRFHGYPTLMGAKCLAVVALAHPNHALSLITKARSREGETRNGRTAKRNLNFNQETILLGPYSLENLKRVLERWFPDSDLNCVLHSNDHFESHLLGNGYSRVLSTTRMHLGGSLVVLSYYQNIRYFFVELLL